MAQNISLMGATYSAVPAVTLPKQGGGSATFTDVTDTTAAASDVASGKYFYTAAGVRTAGTSSGGGSSMQVAVEWTTLGSASNSISFTGLAGEPTSFIVLAAADITTGGTKAAAVVYDGTNTIGQTITSQVTYDGSGFSYTYNAGTLTVTGSATFQADDYRLTYTYGGSVSDIGTADVQVGSGATSITFTDLPDEPAYFSVIFKSDFSTSSGYQRVIAVVADVDDTCGLSMDSAARAQASWSYSYSGGSLTITSIGTNNGGYFHQPGYYQLTYGIGDQTLQTKTVTPDETTQDITADAGYTALKKVVVNPIPSQYIVPTGNYAITSNGNNIDIAQYATVSVNVPGGGGGSSYTAVTNKSYTVNTSSTSAVTTETWSTGHSEIWTSSKIVYIRIRDTVGARAGYFYGTDNYFFIQYPANGATNTSFSTGMRNIIYCNTNGKFGQVCYTSGNGYGIYADTIYNDGRIRIRQRYNNNYSLTINSTYKVEVYLLGTPDNVAPYVAP